MSAASALELEHSLVAGTAFVDTLITTRAFGFDRHSGSRAFRAHISKAALIDSGSFRISFLYPMPGSQPNVFAGSETGQIRSEATVGQGAAPINTPRVSAKAARCNTGIFHDGGRDSKVKVDQLLPVSLITSLPVRVSIRITGPT